MALDKDRIKESLDEKDIRAILLDLGSAEPKKDMQGNLIFTTVCHNGIKHKLYYYKDTYIFHCYTDCGSSMDIYSLVEKVKSVSFSESIKYVGNLTGKMYTVNNIENKNEQIDDWKWINKFKNKRKKNLDVNLKIYDEKILDVFLPYIHEEWLNEGISVETAEKFNVGYYFKGEKITIPHFDINGNLVGIRGRSMLQEDIDNGRKYMPLIIENTLYNHPTMFNLYGLHKTQEAIKKLKKVAIFESEKSVLKCEDFYGEDNFSVATCSSNLSEWQIQMLLSLGAEEFFIGHDKEFKDHESETAYQYAEKLMKFGRKIAPYAQSFILWDKWDLLEEKNSPVDKGKEVLEELMRKKIEIKTIEDVVN